MATKFSDFPDATSLDYEVGLSGGANAKVRPPKKYVALLGQTGTDAPIATVLEPNTLGNIVWTRDNPGHYSGTLTGAFTNSKTAILIQKSARDSQDNNLLYTISARTESIDSVNVFTCIADIANGTVEDSDGLLDGSTTIQIWVYY